MKKVKIQKKLFWHIQVDLREIWNNFFFAQAGRLAKTYQRHTLNLTKQQQNIA
jgi:hypothetical protein